MPLLRYFIFIGIALLGLLFLTDAYFPKEAIASASASVDDRPALRIRSDQQWPERIVLDTNQPTIVPQVSEPQRIVRQVVPSIVKPEAVADAIPAYSPLEALAQLPSTEPKKVVRKMRKRKLARSHRQLVMRTPVTRTAENYGFDFFGTVFR